MLIGGAIKNLPWWIQTTSDVLGQEINISKDKLKIKHSFSHYNLDIDSLILKFESAFSKKLGNNQMWFNVNDLKSVGTPAPVTKIIEKVI